MEVNLSGLLSGFTKMSNSVPRFRAVITTSTTYYLVASAAFGAGTSTGYGRLSATRVG